MNQIISRGETEYDRKETDKGKHNKATKTCTHTNKNDEKKKKGTSKANAKQVRPWSPGLSATCPGCPWRPPPSRQNKTEKAKGTKQKGQMQTHGENKHEEEK